MIRIAPLTPPASVSLHEALPSVIYIGPQYVEYEGEPSEDLTLLAR
jgi:hypothetical protein